ncbi:FCSD flavin-binding domain-containing protein [Caldovatus sp. SYSU G05006]|uniref:FCSD flavin-binding domain-containing protein n=2 Tax=Caldovatus aquaticus TaxID=2865671 RepID=A0ABS7F175_9PROT|nr:FCSD flavin-binding domain-containing protein [Caldovatus aquaticus]MBW8269349.1 FCSD flavin-binding domain-containing protein [Caldovatus aquaticus]
MIEWVAGDRDGKVTRVDPRKTVLETEFGTRHKVAVANVIPPQMAAPICAEAGLTDRSGWVPVAPRTFESRAQAGIHAVGDANIGSPMPKSGFIASNTAKQAVASAVALLRGQAPPEPVYYSTCYSHVGENHAISVVNIYRNEQGAIAEVPNAGGVSPRGEMPEQRMLEARYADAWYASITQDMFS